MKLVPICHRSLDQFVSIIFVLLSVISTVLQSQIITTSSSSTSSPPRLPCLQYSYFLSKLKWLSSYQDYIRNTAFDHHGRRIATCYGDRTVKI